MPTTNSQPDAPQYPAAPATIFAKGMAEAMLNGLGTDVDELDDATQAAALDVHASIMVDVPIALKALVLANPDVLKCMAAIASTALLLREPSTPYKRSLAVEYIEAHLDLIDVYSPLAAALCRFINEVDDLVAQAQEITDAY